MLKIFIIDNTCTKSLPYIIYLDGHKKLLKIRLVFVSSSCRSVAHPSLNI